MANQDILTILEQRIGRAARAAAAPRAPDVTASSLIGTLSPPSLMAFWRRRPGGIKFGGGVIGGLRST